MARTLTQLAMAVVAASLFISPVISKEAGKTTNKQTADQVAPETTTGRSTQTLVRGKE